MAHLDPTPLRWPEYFLIKTLTFLEGIVLTRWPRGAIRKRLLTHVDRLLKQIHANRCDKP